MKALRKILSLAAAVAVIGAYAVFPAYASPDETTTTAAASEEDEIDQEIPIESSEDIDDPDDDDADVSLLPDDDPPETSVTDAAPVETSTTTTTAAATPPATSSQAPSTYTPVSQQYKVYSSGSVNVRSSPNTRDSSNIIGSVSYGEAVTVIGTSGDWYVISINGREAYVMASLFTANPPSQTSAATTQATPAPTRDTTRAPETATIEDPATASTEDTTAEPEPAVTTKADDDDSNDTPTTTKKPAETTEEAEETEAGAASTNDGGSGGSGIKGLLIALGCGIGTFLLLGVVPVVAHSIYHKKLYQY